MNPSLSLAAIALLLSLSLPMQAQDTPPPMPASIALEQIEYRNAQYGFCFTLPASWQGYTIVSDGWDGTPRDGGPAVTGPKLLIRNPAWMAGNPREDIPILIFTTAQWRRVVKERMSVSAAPFNPFQLGHNRRYVFAVPARFDFDQLPGVEEVSKLVMSKSLRAPCR
ncbi:MAG: hypothetical protein P4L26_10940 [Terracidiphilus sp.]|nr:hypothetical protein [Terracidiphilus sp.]